MYRVILPDYPNYLCNLNTYEIFFLPKWGKKRMNMYRKVKPWKHDEKTGEAIYRLDKDNGDTQLLGVYKILAECWDCVWGDKEEFLHSKVGN